MGVGIPKVHEETIPKELGDVSLVALDDFSADVLVGTHHVPIVFGIELRREFGGIDQVAEHDGELPSFRIRRRRYSRERFNRSWFNFLSYSMLSRWCGGWLWFCFRCTNPDKDSAVFIDSQALGIDDFFFEILNVVVVEVKLTLQSPIRHTSSTAEEVYNLVEYFVEVHYRPSSSSFNNVFASFRSAVSNPSVNHPYTGARRS